MKDASFLTVLVYIDIDILYLDTVKTPVKDGN